jgi:hypothetical protein
MSDQDSGFIDLNRHENLPEKTDDSEGWMQAYAELQQQYSDLRIEYGTVIKTVIRALDALGMWPVPENMDMSVLGRKVSGLIFQAMKPGGSLKDRFAFMKDVIPIAEKYRDINVNNL